MVEVTVLVTFALAPTLPLPVIAFVQPQVGRPVDGAPLQFTVSLNFGTGGLDIHCFVEFVFTVLVTTPICEVTVLLNSLISPQNTFTLALQIITEGVSELTGSIE
ncbi:hypothetical protein ATO13_22356 [Stappia sp. 22II-S9-Z10]|nr:hypothetical protein ATO13_22356 [Stappia sp. 22II-S9-Z10]